MPNRILEEENIDWNLAHFQHQGLQPAIQEWRQRIEEREAPLAHRPPKTIDAAQAIQDFRHALLGDTEHSKSAEGLLRKLNQPAQPKFTAAEAWRLQNPENRPATLTPEQQAYVDHYDRNEQERRKWCVDISTERWERWGTLEEVIWDCTKRAENAQGATEDAKHFTKHAEKARNELHADLAKVGEQWMAENPELARQLVDQFTGKLWVKPVPTEAFKEYRSKELAALKGTIAKPSEFFSGPWAASPVFPQEAFYRGRLYFIAANLILKHFGFNDAVAASVLQDIEGEALSREWDYRQLVDGPDESEQDSDANQDKKVLACKIVAGRVYLNLYDQLKRHGADFIPMLELHLSKALTELLNDPDQLDDRSSTSFSDVAADYDKKYRDKDNDGDNLDKALLKRSDDFRNLASPERRQLVEEQQQAHHQKTDDLRATLQALKDQLNPRQLNILLLLLEKGHTHDSIAQQLELNPKTIQRERRKIEYLARQFRSQRQI